MLVETGEICKYRLQKETGIVEELYEVEAIQDQEGHALGQKASIIKFMKLFPPKVQKYFKRDNSYLFIKLKRLTLR